LAIFQKHDGHASIDVVWPNYMGAFAYTVGKK